MNTPVGFKQRLGEELALLERTRAEQAAEDTPVAARRVFARRVFARTGVRRTAFVGLAAGAVATTVVATSGSQRAQTPPVRAMTVAQVLDAAAVHAAKGTDTEPGLHQWLYTDTVVCWPKCGHEPSWERYDGAKGASVGRTSGTGNRNVVLVTDISHPRRPGKVGDQPRRTRDVLARLPTDPHQLLKRVSTDPFFDNSGEQPGAALTHNLGERHDFSAEQPAAVTPGAQFTRILTILQTASAIPPQINAALYHALALIPGTELVSSPMPDAAGRPGITITFDFHDRSRTHEYLFLDPGTYAYRGSRLDWHGDSSFSHSFALVATGIVDHPGQVPGGPAPDPSSVVEESPIVLPPKAL